jgi:FAD:protein FMN transferase
MAPSWRSLVTRADLRFRSMGCDAHVRLEAPGRAQSELDALAREVRETLEEVEAVLSRFRPESELCALNADARAVVPASPILARFAREAATAWRRSGGLVDATLLAPLEGAGYQGDWDAGRRAQLEDALAAAPRRRPARGRSGSAAGEMWVDGEDAIHRPPGTRLDSGGLGKGLAAELALERLPAGVRAVIAVGGDLALRGAGMPWEVAVHGARTGAEIHRLVIADGGVATSGIQARLWAAGEGHAHHLLDPSTGLPAWTGLLAATAVAGSALDAEVLAKTALLSGPGRAREVLRRGGGVLQREDGSVELVRAPAVRTVRLAVTP